MKSIKWTLTLFEVKIHRVFGKLRLFLPLHHPNKFVLHRKIARWIFCELHDYFFLYYCTSTDQWIVNSQCLRFHENRSITTDVHQRCPYSSYLTYWFLSLNFKKKCIGVCPFWFQVNHTLLIMDDGLPLAVLGKLQKSKLINYVLDI